VSECPQPDEANRETIREAFEAWKKETGSITLVIAPKMVWWGSQSDSRRP
jgi:hypothetical protein